MQNSCLGLGVRTISMVLLRVLAVHGKTTHSIYVELAMHQSD